MSSFLARLELRAGLSVLMVALSTTWARADAIFTVKSVGESLAPNGLEYNVVGNVLIHGPVFDPTQPGGVTVSGGMSPYFGPLPAGFTAGTGILGGQDGNNQVGWASAVANGPGIPPQLAFANLGGQLENLGVVPGTQGIQQGSQAFGVNQSGQVVGMSFSTPGNQWIAQPFLYTVSQGMSAIATPGGGNGQAIGINDAGLIVGIYATGSRTHGFISDNGGPAADLNQLISPSLGWTITRAGAIDSAGDIAALGYDSSGTLHTLMLAPVNGLSMQQVMAAIDNQGATGVATSVPEPSTLAVLVTGASLCAWRSARKRKGHRD